MDNQSLFNQTYSQIQSKLLGGSNQNFQLLGNPIDFSWPVPPTGQESLAAYQIMSMIPKWSPVGTFVAGDSDFFSAYARVLSLVTFKVSPEKQNDLQGLRDQLTAATNNLQKLTSDTNTTYQTEKQNGGAIFTAMYPDIATWLKGPGSAYTTQIANQTAAVNELSNQYADFLTNFSTDPTLRDDFSIIKRPTSDIGGPAPRGWTKVANSDGSLAWQPVFNIGTTAQDWRAKLAAGTAGGFSVDLDASKSDYDLDKSWAKASAGYDAIFWGVSGSGGWERTTQMASDSSVTAKVTVASSTLVPITPGPWYDGGLMRALARNNLGPGVVLIDPWTATGGKGSQSVFGQYGLLSTRVSGLVVVYKPSYSITMQSSTYSSFHEKIEAGGGLRIGPFTFGGNGGHEKTTVRSTGNMTTIEGASTSDNPLIVGVTVAFPGEDEA